MTAAQIAEMTAMSEAETVALAYGKRLVVMSGRNVS
jgi:hypothetical protein